MKNQKMALVAVGAIVLLSACGTETTTDSGSSTDENAAGATNMQVCEKYFDQGDLPSVAQRVDEELEYDMSALTDEQSNAMRSTNIQLEAILRLAGPEETNLVLNEIKAPFQMADDLFTGSGTTIDTTGAAEAVAELEAICDTAGYTAP